MQYDDPGMGLRKLRATLGRKNMMVRDHFVSTRIAAGAIGPPRVAISFDDEMHEEIRQIAIKEKRSFAAVVRELVRVGLRECRP